MASNVIDSILDEDKIQKQLDKLDSQLTKSTENLAKCAVQAKAFSDAFANAKGINDIIKLMEAYNQTIVNAQKAQNDVVKITNLQAEAEQRLIEIEKLSNWYYLLMYFLK